MMNLGLGELVLCAIIAAMPIGAVAVIFFLVRGTQRKTDFGINLSPPKACPGCGAPLPSIRTPASVREAMWGGWTCACGLELDKWGRPRNAPPPQ